MSKKHPVIAITGSSGAGTSTVKNAFNHIFERVGAKPVVIEGDSFHKYDRKKMAAAMEKKNKMEIGILVTLVLKPIILTL